MYSTVGTPWVEDGLVLIPYAVLMQCLYDACMVYTVLIRCIWCLCATYAVLIWCLCGVVWFLYGAYAVMRYLYCVYGACMVLMQCLCGAYMVLVWYLYCTYAVLIWCLSGLDGLTDGGANGGQACRAFWQLCRRFRRAMKKEASGTIAKGLYVQMFGSVSNSVSGLSPQTF